MEVNKDILPESAVPETPRESLLRRVLRGTVSAFFTLVSLVLLLLLGLQFPTVQTWLGGHATRYLSDMTGFEMRINRLAIRWLDNVVLRGVLVKDRAGAVMIAASELGVDYDLMALIEGKDIVLNRARLDSVAFHLISDGKDGELNINELIDAFSSGKPDTTPSTAKFIIERAVLNNCTFGYNRPQKDAGIGKDEFDYYHFVLDKINGEVRDFVSVQDSILLQIKDLSAHELALDWPIHRFNTSFLYCDKGIFFDDLDMRIGKSYLRRRISLTYDTPDAMDDFNNRVRINAELDSTTLHTDDIAHFAPSLKSWDISANISGSIDGHVSRLNVRNMRLYFGQNTNINGNLSFDGLPETDQTLMQFQFRQSRLDMNDVKPFLSEENFATVQKFGDVRFNGQFVGYVNDFVARGQFETALGIIKPDINLKLDQKSYSGQIITEGFHLGQVAEVSLLGLIDADVSIKGKGFSIDEMETDIAGRIGRLGLRGYNYKNIQTDVFLKKGIAEGYLKVNDPNFTFDGSGEVNLKDSVIRLKASLEKADLEKLNFTDKPSVTRAGIDCNFKGLTLDNLTGDIRLDSFYFAYDKKDILFDTLNFHSERNGAMRTFYIRSDLIDLESEGNFRPSTTIDDLSKLIDEYMLYIGNDREVIEKYYSEKLAKKLKARKPIVETPYAVDYLIRVKNLSPFIQIFVPDFYIARNTELKGQFRSGETKDFDVLLSTDTLRYGSYFLKKIAAAYQTVKVADANQINAKLNIQAAYLNQTAERGQTDTLLQNLWTDAEWLRDKIAYTLSAKAAHSDDHGAISGDFRFLPEKRYMAAFHPSFAILSNRKWENTDTATVTIQGREIAVKDFYFSDGQRFISVKGGISEDPETTLEVEIRRIGIELLSNFVGKKIEGEADGKVFLKDLYHQIQANGFVFAHNVKMEGFLLGEIRNFVKWNQEAQSLAMESRILRDSREVLLLNGTYKQSDNELDLNIDLKQTEINVLESFLSEIASQFGGRAEGKLRVYGQADAPQISGEVFVTGGRFKVNYLNTTYFFDDRILFDDDRIAVKRLRLRDDEQNVAFVDGGVYHYGFTNFIIDVTSDFRRFKVLDTQQTEDALYYGTAIGTGRMEIFGPPENLKITVNATSERGTRIFMPLDGYASAEEKNFIRFVSLKPDTATQDTVVAELQTQRALDLSKLVITLNLDITPDAYMEIILDRKAGDIIRGNARGKLKMDLDTKGDFTMFGDVEIVKGSYTFTFQNLFNKSFDINQGSSIAWNGDPFKGKMNITASYDQKVALAPILSGAQLDSATLNRPELKRRYPVRVDLFLTGELLKPLIKYDVVFFDYPRTIVAGGVPISLETYIAAFKARLAGDEQELQKQVFSLLMLRKLLPENAFEGIGQSAGNSLSELITNQLSAWMSQVDDNLEVDIDLNGFDANALNTMQLRLSYSFLNGRMRITRDGSFTNVQNQANISSIAGDWTVEYLLTQDGRVRMKMYRRNISNTFNAALLGANATTGASMMYTRSFNHVSELFGKKRRKSKQKDKSVIPYRDSRIYIPTDEEEIQ
ncbi:translocation/assembly module TamB domain-containing protein [Rhodoflexus caldus]|uniref:translocation/assembly module TamB domain-containing protein n=1 Tax=Rhodoflexus caldus TaxID=2891236 RepID=UPI00202A5D5C|nr:translocation/assembly module TamB domain-containing protein [Rhodoflexus caldus]